MPSSEARTKDSSNQLQEIVARMDDLEVALKANTELTLRVAQEARQAVAEGQAKATQAALEAIEPIKIKTEQSYVMTQQVLDLLRAAKAGLSVLKYLGYLATPAVAIATAYHYFLGGIHKP